MRHTIHSLVSLLSIITLSAAGCGSEQPAEDDARGAASTGTGAETGSGGEGAAGGGNAGGGDGNAGGGNAGGGDGNAGGGNAGGGGGGETPSAYVEVADGVAHLAFSSTPATCGAAPDFPDDCTDRDEFLLEVEIPIDLLVVGTVDLNAPGVDSFQTSQGPFDGESCAMGIGGTYGTLSILEVTEESVRVRVFESEAFQGSARDFELERCGERPVPTQPEWVSEGFGGLKMEEDDEDYPWSYEVRINDFAGASCPFTYELPEDCATRAHSLTVSFPPELAVDGNVVDLTAETVEHGYTEQAPDGDECWSSWLSRPIIGTLTFGVTSGTTREITFAGTNDPILEGSHTLQLCADE